MESRCKARAFDRILEKYQTLRDDAGFYSSNWVELAEIIESEWKRLQWLSKKKESLPGPEGRH
ncbi:MAG: hypothetical protein ACE5JX_00460 [Acidobacteriota bacterium]